jgi:hypothetical protein
MPQLSDWFGVIGIGPAEIGVNRSEPGVHRNAFLCAGANTTRER